METDPTISKRSSANCILCGCLRHAMKETCEINREMLNCIIFKVHVVEWIEIHCTM